MRKTFRYRLYPTQAQTQALEQPSCAACEQPLKMIYQLDSESRHGLNVDLNLGKQSLGHIWLCTDRPEQVLFKWKEKTRIGF